MPLDATPLRILLASARPLILKIERGEAELSDMATRHIAAAATALQTVADIGRFQADGRTIRFELYPTSVGGFPMASWKSTASRPAPPSNW